MNFNSLNKSLMYQYLYHSDPAEKEEQRQQIARQTKEYLAKGHKIHVYDIQINRDIASFSEHKQKKNCHE